VQSGRLGIGIENRIPEKELIPKNTPCELFLYQPSPENPQSEQAHPVLRVYPGTQVIRHIPEIRFIKVK
jgi:hypothetical protein